MARKYFYPTSLDAQIAWYANFISKIGQFGTDIGWDAAKIDATKTQAQLVLDSMNAVTTAQNVVAQKMQDRKAAIANNQPEIFKEISAFKKDKDYTDALGELIGIVGSEIVVDYSTVQTVVALSKDVQGVHIKFKLEHCEGGDIYCKRGNETVFTYLKHVTHPDTIDKRTNLDGANAEKRDYYVVLTYHDEQVGLHSLTSSITV